MTPVVTNQTSSMVVIPMNTSDSSRHDSDYYKDLMNKYKIDEQYSKNKSDKNKARSMYNYSKKRYEEERRSDDIWGVICITIIAAVIIAFICMFIFF